MPDAGSVYTQQDAPTPGALPTFGADVQQYTRVRQFQGTAGQDMERAFGGLSRSLAWPEARAAEDAGVQAGKVAGLDPNYRPDQDESFYGIARRNAADALYSNTLEASARQQLNDAYATWQAQPAAQRDPAALQASVAKIKADFDQNHVFPQVQGQFDNSFNQIASVYQKGARSDADARLQDQAKASFLQNDNAAQTTVLRTASIPSASDEDIAKALNQRNAAVDAGVAQGTWSAVQGEEMKQALTQQALRQRATTLFDNLPDDQKPAAAANFIKSFSGQGDYFGAVRRLESGGNDAATNGDAVGRYQFMSGTWQHMMAAHPDLGLTANGRTDPAQQDRAMQALTADNDQQLSAAGLPITSQNRYAAHFLGAGGAIHLVGLVGANPNQSAVAAFPEEAKYNPTIFTNKDGSAKSVGDVYSWIGNQIARGGAGQGQTSGMDLKTVDSVGAYMNAQLRAQQSQAEHMQRAALADIDGDVKQMEKGIDVPDQEWSAKAQEYGASPNPAVKQAFQEGDAMRSMYQGFRGLNPEQVDSQVEGMRAQAAQGGATPAQAKLIEAGQTYATRLRAEVARDPNARAVTEGLIKQPPPLDFSDPAKLAATLAQRIPAADQVAQRFGLARPQYMGPDEKEKLKAIAAAGGEPAVQTAAAIASTLGPRAGAFFAEAGGDAPQFAQMGRIAAMGGDASVLRDAAWAVAQDHVPGSKVERPAPEALNQAAGEAFGDAFKGIPDFALGARTLAANAIAAQIAREGYDPKAVPPEIVAQTLQKAAGATFVGNTQYGGVASYKPGGGSFWSAGPGWGAGGASQKVLAPGDVRTDQFGSVIGAIQDGDLKGLPSPAVDAKGNSMTADQLKGAFLTSVGPGVYAVSKGDPNGPDPQWATTATGSRFVLDLNSMAPALRQRVPQAYKGVAPRPLEAPPQIPSLPTPPALQ